MMRADVNHCHVAPQEPSYKFSLHGFVFAKEKLLIQEVFLSQPPHAAWQPQGNRHSGENAPRAICQCDVFAAHGARQEPPNPLRQRSARWKILCPGISHFLGFENQSETSNVDWPAGSHHDGAALRVFASVAEIVVIGQRCDAIDFCKARAVKHFYQAALTRVTRHLRKALVVLPRLLAQKQSASLFRQAHTFEHQAFFGDGTEVSNGLQWILQVIEQPETKHKIKLPQSGDFAGFNVRLLKGNSGKALARFLDIFRACIKPASGQTASDRKSTRLNSSHMSISYAVF